MQRKHIAISISLAITTQAALAQNTDSQDEIIAIKGQAPMTTHISETDLLIGQQQALTSDDLANMPSRSLAEIMRNQLTSVNINHVQNNPFQPDVQYRGFTASPLLGLPQGLSMYMNGVRFNEPFGDTVNWDLVPLEALDNAIVYSTSNPVFGQNTLGGAIALNTKTGFTFTGTEIDLSLGQFGRQEFTLETGMNKDEWGFYAMITRYEEDGWRDYSPSEVNQVFTTLSYQTEKAQFDLSYLGADNELLGNGAIPEALPEFESRSSVFTHPDQTNNELHFLSLVGSYQLHDDLELHANVFFRDNTTSSINGDDSDYGACAFADGRITLCELEDDDDDDDHDDDEHDDDDGDHDDDEFPIAGVDAEAVDFIGHDGLALSEISNVDPSTLDGTYNTGEATNTSYGISVQLDHSHQFGALPSTTMYGFGYIEGDIHYKADTAFGVLDNDDANGTRTVTPLALFDDEARVRLDVDTTAAFAYISNITQLSDKLTVNVAARYNYDNILMEDLIDDGQGSLDGDHSFNQFNPAIGINYQINDQTRFNISYAQSSRVPSPAELSCADENDPCRLPNGFVADPPLDEVITRTLEATLSGNNAQWDYSATLYHSVSKDDIIFQQAGTVASRGYFINIDETRRVGAEFSLEHSYDNGATRLSYNLLNATFESAFTSFSPANPLGPNRQVSPGDTIPGQPKHQIKLMSHYNIGQNWRVGVEGLYASEQYYRGDEANENATIDGYELINLYAQYNVNAHLSLSLRIDNALDKEFDTFGTYGEADEVLEDIYPEIEDPNFVGPAHPRMVSVLASYRF